MEAGELLAGRYRVERVLGRGGFGVTVAAHDTQTGHLVAVKRLDLRDVDDWKSVELFEREAAVLRRLDHPRIPRYVEFVPIAADEAGLLVQALAPGRSLQAHLDEGRTFDEAQVRDLAAQLLEILIYLGDLRPAVVHRDIKPANIVMAEDGTLRLVDFGAVKQAAAAASTIGSTVAGTFGYMGPEQIQGVAEPRSDLYSLGMTMIALLTGEAPTDLPRKRLKPEFGSLVKLSPGLARFIDKLIEPVPDDRHMDARAAKAALDDAIVAATLADPGADLRALVAAKELSLRQKARQAETAARGSRDRAIAKLAGRPDRVRVAQAGGRTKIEIEPQFLRDKLKEQLPWGFGFAFINPGVFIMMGIGALLVAGLEVPVGVGAVLTVLIWGALLTLANTAYALATRRRMTLELSEDGHFALYERTPKKPLLLGHARDLVARIDEPDPAKLGEVRFEDERRRAEVEKLSHRDLEALRQALQGRCKTD